MINIKRAVINFLGAYLLVTIICYSLGIMVGAVLDLPSAEELGVNTFEEPSFLMTVPYQLLTNLLVWTTFGWLYLKKKGNSDHLLKESIGLAMFWLVLGLTVDLVVFVLIKTPYSLTPYQFYIEYQPWITITYLIVLVSPLISYGLIRLRNSEGSHASIV